MLNRRSFLQLMVVGGAAAIARPAWAEKSSRAASIVPHFKVKPFELDETTIAGLQAGMKTGKYSAVSLVKKYLARIEVGRGELPRLLEDDMRGRVSAALRNIGYAHVTVDLQGYRRGSLNELVRQNVEAS